MYRKISWKNCYLFSMETQDELYCDVIQKYPIPISRFSFEGMELIEQGAEARIYKTLYLGKCAIVKERFKKKYRHPPLDEHILYDRLRAESRGLMRGKLAGVRVPAVYFVDLETGSLCIEYLDGSVAKKYIDYQLTLKSVKDNVSLLEVMALIGRGIGKLHSKNVIHGDLTTSNMIVHDKNILQISFIDFGLSYHSTSFEDKGVDLYVLERALKSTHPSAEELFDGIIAAYKDNYKLGSKEVLIKFKEVKARGRKRTMVG